MKSATRTLVSFFAVLGIVNLLLFLGLSGNGGPGFGWALFFSAGGFLCAMIYFVPTILGFERAHPNGIAILIVNLFFGWTLIGWVAALVWALTVNRAVEILEAQERARTDSARTRLAAEPQSPRTHVPRDLSVQRPSEDTAVPATKACLFCAEQVLAAAIKCKHCGSDISAPPVPT